MSTWLVMASVEISKNNGLSFDANATGLTEGAAKAEASRRNAVEKAAGHVGVDWFPAQDPLAMMASQMGISVEHLRATLG
ncbi:hypothetical protein [Sphingomonas sp. 3-13AW]|uniref:hypothetical protein n=1 Tax=Sphingomonas sp. 3-13AW TaxID=3050450 RepID=UPI003BB4D80B